MTQPSTWKRWWVGTAAVISILTIGGCAASSDDPGISNAVPETSDPVAEDTTEPPAEPQFTAAQENAIEAANNYLDLSPFSRKGLIAQLSSSAGDGYPRSVAKFAVAHIDVDYKEQAVKAAQAYLDISSFSKAGLIEQLSSSAGDQYTVAEATYAANQVYK